MNLKDLENQAKAIATTVRDYCAKAVAPLLARMDELDKKVNELQTKAILKDGDDTNILVELAMDMALAKIPAPKDGAHGEKGEPGERGADGKSITLDEVEPLVAKAVAQIPAPKDGAPGEKGEPGERGADGKSITLDEIEPLVAKAVAQIPAPKDGAPGEKGEPGERGAEGQPGKDGADGKSFTLDEVSTLVEAAVEARFAKMQLPETVTLAQAQKMVDEAVAKIALPRDGKDGRDGVDGRDAVALEILPAIDEAKSYPRNTYAIHKGGLFRTFEKSEAMRGWECLVEGVAEINFEQLNAREFSVNIAKSSGAIVTHKAHIPVPVYKGVYKEGDDYANGDMVTWAGAVWHCEEPTSEKPGEGTKGWRLAVKRGRDGKNGTNGRDLVNGVKI